MKKKIISVLLVIGIVLTTSTIAFAMDNDQPPFKCATTQVQIINN